MDGIRLKLSAKTVGDKIHFNLDWVDVVNEEIKSVIGNEEFAMSVKKCEAGCAYVSRVSFREGEEGPGTFWIDENGLRHFLVSAEKGNFDFSGSETTQLN